MSSEWSTCRLADLATFKYGKFLSKSHLDTSGFPVFSGYGVVGYLPTFQHEQPQLIIVCRGEGGTGDVKMSPPKCSITNLSIVISENDQIVCKEFLYWALKAANTRRLRTGSAQAQIVISSLENFTLSIPADRSEQVELASILSALDERIVLLHQTNSTLESIAQALFKSWFVDFDPVRAKQEGRAPEGMDAETAASFPDGFEESVLGVIPTGWKTCSVYDLATYINGAAYKAFDPNAERRGLPIIKIAELKSGVTTQTAFSDVQMPEKYRIRSGDILFSWSGNPDTSIDTFVWTHGEAWLNQHIFRVLPHAPGERSFVLRTLRYLRPTFAELARNKQTTGLGHVTVSDMKRLMVAKPERMILEQFTQRIDPIQNMIFNNQLTAQTLATIRDTLLPRLISGQLRLPDAEAMIKEAA